ncbi:outer membrane protein assembly factor BamB family protein [Candidatus Uabimicrobium amorphum]|uniref:Protein kinase n=1 Tax=Uabimicrobium amorphum TaxID=2596890 RepID=A0A5S9ISE2_UABAM|nr:PQQ-binding-like beta-propeller repeat protein [Candidatus Uabimicrobium amorphum]BBM85815.1 protein kinase [Candidatus Uabimicrobium amorphum]
MPRILIFFSLCITIFAQTDNWPMQHRDAQSSGISQSTLADTLEEKWVFEVEEGVKSTAAIVNGKVYVSTVSGKIISLNLTDGKKNWEFSTESVFSASPSVIDNVVYVGDEDGVLYAVEAQTGKKLWTFDECEDKIVSGVNSYKQRLVFGSYDHHLYCLSKDGKLVWKVETDAPVHGTPCVIEENAVIAGCDGLIRFINITTGKEKGHVDGKSYFAAAPTFGNGKVAIGSLNGDYYCIDYAQMKTVWSIEKKAGKGECYASAIIDGDRVIFASKKRRLFAVDIKSGKDIWQYKTRSRMETSPVIVGEKIVFAEFSGKIHFLNRKDGKHLWTFETGSRIYASPAIAQGYLVIGCDDGTIYALGK